MSNSISGFLSSICDFFSPPKHDPIATLPSEIGLQIFSCLDPDALANCQEVSKLWQIFSNDNTLWIRHYTTLAVKKWEMNYGKVGKVPALPTNIRQILNSPCPFWPDKKIKETHILVLRPKTVNEKPLTRKYFVELLEARPEGRLGILFRGRVDFEICKDDEPATESEWFLKTRDSIPGSENMNDLEQKKFVATIVEKFNIPYQIPDISEATISFFLPHSPSSSNINWPPRYPHSRWLTITRVTDKDNKNLELIAGSTNGTGLLSCSEVMEYSPFYLVWKLN